MRGVPLIRVRCLSRPPISALLCFSGVSPAVFGYKKNIFALLGKPGYDEAREALEAPPEGSEVSAETEEVPEMKQGAIFDMDGLLLDTERVYQENWMETARRFGQTPFPEFPTAVSGTNGEEQRRVIRRYYPEVDAWAFQRDCISRVDGILNHRCAPEKPGAREILEFFRGKGVQTAVASSSGRERILSNLRQTGLENLFDAIVSGQEVAQGKPEPDIFLLAAERIGCAPEECYVFEDSINGVRAGMAAGCVTVMIPDLVPPPEGLAVSRVCASLLEARELIEKGLL